MTVDAAELVAQVVATLIIVTAIEARAYLKTATLLDGLTPSRHADRPKEVVPVAVVYLAVMAATTITLTLCLHSVITDEPLNELETQTVQLGVSIQLLLAVFLPALMGANALWKDLAPDSEIPSWFKLMINLGLSPRR